MQIFPRKTHQYGENIDVISRKKIINLILNVREDARKRKDWGTSDNIRDELKKIGYEIQDTDKGPVWRKNN